MKIKHLSALLLFMLLGCETTFDTTEINNEALTRATVSNEGEVFYYYGVENRKIYLNQVKDQLYLKFASGAPEEQRHIVSSSSFKVLNSRTDIVSATHLLEVDGTQMAYTDEFTVKFKPKTSYAQLQKLAAKNDCTIGAENEFVENQYVLYISRDSDLDAIQMANRFYETGLFEFSQANFIWLNAAITNDSYWSQQWGLKYSSSYGIDIESAWIITTGSPNVRVAVIDEGVELLHPDLRNNVLPGYNATGSGVSAGAPLSNKDWHGTVVAGVIAAEQNNSIGISGVAPNCKIVPVRVKNAHGEYKPADIANGINWVANNSKAEVINISLAGSHDAEVNTAIKNALSKGCVVVAGSGNNNSSSVKFPANVAGVIAVGAIKQNGTRLGDSNYGSALDVVAPGERIPTTYVGSDYAYANQTSIATPHVSGIAALMLSAYPNMTRQQVEEAITKSATKLSAYFPSYATGSSRHNEVGYGLANAFQALCFPLEISGKSDVWSDVDYAYSVGAPPAGMRFAFWQVTPNSYTATGSMDSRNLNIKFNTPGTYTLTALFQVSHMLIQMRKSVHVAIQPPSISCGGGQRLQGVDYERVMQGMYFISCLLGHTRQYGLFRG